MTPVVLPGKGLVWVGVDLQKLVVLLGSLGTPDGFTIIGFWAVFCMGLPVSNFPSVKRCLLSTHMGVSKNRGTPKWMVYKENTL